MTGALDPKIFAEGPARDERFSVREVWEEMANFPQDDPRVVPEFLHRQMNEEINGLEISTRNLADFSEVDWDLRMEIARQCADEARHIEVFRRHAEARGVEVGHYPVMNFQYRIVTRIESLVGRLAVQNRSFEAAGLDAIQSEIDRLTASGEDDDLLSLYEAQLADEIHHVRYANIWVQRLLQQSGPRAVMDVARAVAQANQALDVIAGEGETYYPVAAGVRREAGFNDAEIETARAMVG